MSSGVVLSSEKEAKSENSFLKPLTGENHGNMASHCVRFHNHIELNLTLAELWFFVAGSQKLDKIERQQISVTNS